MVHDACHNSDVGCSVVPPYRETDVPRALPRVLHAPLRPTQGGSGGGVRRAAAVGEFTPMERIQDSFLDVASEFSGVGVEDLHPRCSFMSFPGPAPVARGASPFQSASSLLYP